MTQNYSVLIIEDHPLTADSYTRALIEVGQADQTMDFDISYVNNCESGYQEIKNASTRNGVDLIFLGILLPPSKDRKILSGEDLGAKIRELLPKTKIIVSTSYNTNYRIHNIFKNVNPDGFLVKSDIDFEELVKSIKKVIVNLPYYSETVLKSIRKQMSNTDVLDKIDRSILHELSIGTRMKDLPKVIPMCMNGIEKRKQNLNVIFNITNQNDKELLRVARERGFI